MKPSSWTTRATAAVAISAVALVGVAARGQAATTSSALAAYGFDEGSGANVADGSGHGVSGSAVSTTWAQGRYGSALNFNGSSSRVVSAASISLPATFTIEAWILNPTGAGYETIASVGTNRDLFLADSQLGFFDGMSDVTFGAVPVGRWTHVALTSDGTNLRAYVDGALLSTRARAVAATSGAVQVGAWPSGSGNVDVFSGVIDEVQVHNRALSATQIATDMATPITGGQAPPPTTTPTTAPPTTTTAPTTTLPPTTTTTAPPSGGANASTMRFFANGYGGIDRVQIPLTPSKSINVGGDLTLEWWMKVAGPLTSRTCNSSNDAWINGNILLDRDVYGAGDRGDFGVSIFSGGIVGFGVSRGSSGVTLCSTAGVADGGWHHVALTRSTSTGRIAAYIDGQARGSITGPTGDISYRENRSGAANDPYLVIGAEKHDAGSEFPSYPGWIDELRISRSVRYSAAFTPPRQELTVDGSTVAMYHFDEGSGSVLTDSTGANPGAVRYGGSPAGPIWTTDRPF